MNQVGQCPSRQELEQLLQGQMPFGQVEQLAQHLEQCESCGQTIQNLQVEDTLVEVLRRRAKALEQPPGPVLQKLLDWLQQLPRQRAGETVAPAPAEAPQVDQGRYAFLAPAQAADELGWLGHYRVLKVLGEGGMGMVFQAEDTQLQRPVALKVMKPELAQKLPQQQRFLREARAAAALRHDNIITIFQVGQENGVPFLAMEFLEGMALDDWLKKGHQPTLAQVLRIGRETARGLAAAHDKGLIHRDIKPGNLWLEKIADCRLQIADLGPGKSAICNLKSEIGRVKILDFGLVRSEADEVHLTGTGTILGTPAYMAPEQARSETVDPRTDLFSLGCVLYRLSTGQLPFSGETTMALLTALALDTPLPPHEINAALPLSLSELILQLLAKEPAGRPASAREVEQALKAIEQELPAQPVPNRAATVRERGQPALASPPLAVPVAVPVGGELTAAAATDPRPSGSEAISEPRPSGSEEETQSRPAAAPLAHARGSFFRRRWPLVAAAVLLLAGASWLLPQIVIRIKDNQGKETRIEVPEGSTVTVEKDGKVVAKVPAGAEKEPIVEEIFNEIKGAEVRRLEDNNEWIMSVAFTPDGKTLASGGGNWNDPKQGEVKLWDVATGKKIMDLKGPERIVHSLAITSDGKQLISGGQGYAGTGSLRVWDFPDGNSRKTINLGKRGTITKVVFSKDNKKYAVSGGQDIRIYLTETHQQVKKIINDSWSVAFSPNGENIAFSVHGVIELWAIVPGQKITVLKGHKGWVISLAFSPDGKYLASGGGNDKDIFFGEFKLWDLSSKKEIASFRRPLFVCGVAFSPDGKLLATCGHDKTVKLYNVAKLKEIGTFLGHTGSVRSVAFSPDGSLLASGSWDGTIRLWRVPKQDP